MIGEVVDLVMVVLVLVAATFATHLLASFAASLFERLRDGIERLLDRRA